MANTRTALVGGGLLGLALARRLAAAGHAVTVYDRARSLGGLASAWSIGPVTWDRFYHVILQSDSHTHELLRELGLADSYIGRPTRTGFYTNGQHHPFTTSLDFARFAPLGVIDKIRLAATILYASRLKNWRPLERVTAADWLTKLSGRRTAELIWKPLLRAKLGDAADRVNAAFIWATIARMYAARRSGLKRETFGTVAGGYATILERFAQYLTSRGVEIRLESRVESVTADGSGVRVTTADGTAEHYDSAIVTAPAPLAADLLPALTDGEQNWLRALEYQGVVCASLLLRKPLADRYVTNITDLVPFTAVIEMTALIPPQEFGGHHLVFLPKYAGANDAIWGESDDSILSRFTVRLAELYPRFDPNDILTTRVARAKQVFAVPTLNYSETVPPFETSIPNIYIVTAAQIVNGTLNVNETLALADRACAGLFGARQSTPAGATA